MTDVNITYMYVHRLFCRVRYWHTGTGILTGIPAGEGAKMSFIWTSLPTRLEITIQNVSWHPSDAAHIETTLGTEYRIHWEKNTLCRFLRHRRSISLGCMSQRDHDDGGVGKLHQMQDWPKKNLLRCKEILNS